MSLYDMYETDPDMEKGGIILNYGDGQKFKIARAGGANVNFAKSLERIMRPYRKQLDNGSLADDVANELFIRVFAETVVKDWEGIDDRAGETMKFSVENCVKLFTDLPELFTDIREAASNISNYRLEQLEEDIKN